jgi:plasmid maintenance system antidote protein VapI
MNATEMRVALEALGISQTELATWLGVGSRSIRRYLDGSRDVPPALALLLAYLLHRPEAVQWFRDRAKVSRKID